MKGKGKTPEEKDKDGDIKDCPLQFPNLCTVDHVKDCPKFSQVLGRDDNGHITLEELDQIQTDLEILLVSVGKRLKQLGSENTILASWPEKKDGKRSSGKGQSECQPSTPTKRKATPTDEREKDREKQSSKKFKDLSGRVTQPSTPNVGPRSKGKMSQSKVQPEDPTNTDSAVAETPKLLKNDAVNRFWAAVEPYCAPITADDLRVVEEMLKSYEEDTEYMKIPSLGVHYTQRWAEEDLMEEQNDGNKMSEKKKCKLTAGGEMNGTASTLLKRADQHKSDYFMDDSPFGPLTQRLVSALIEDNLMTPMDDSMADTAECADEAPAISPRMLAKQLNIGNPATLERRIRKELEEQGILEKEEEETDDPADEVLAELRRKQQELRAVSQQNVNILKSLYRQGQEDMGRQQLKKQLQVSDSEVMEAYRRIQMARQKKKSPTKKEKETIAKVLKDRDALIRALEW